MASVRASVRQHALRLAHTTDEREDVVHVPIWVVEQLRRIAQRAEQPTSTLQWAWRSQHANYLGSRRRADGLAAIYLLAALLADEQGGTATAGTPHAPAASGHAPVTSAQAPVTNGQAPGAGA